MDSMATEALSPHPAPRRWPRYRMDVPVRLVTCRDGIIRYVEGRGRELNEGGMAVFAGGLELKVADQIEVEFTPPYSGDPIRVWGSVRNRSGYYYGLEFIAENIIEKEQVARLRQSLRAAL